MKTLGWIVLIGVLTICISFIWNTCNDTSQVVQKEFNASALLKKYEAFKDISAAIDKKRADIDVYIEELETMEVETKDDKFYYQQRKSELLGLVAMHNELCSEYNSNMSKFNYRFTNSGDLPASNLTPLPREIKPYILSLKTTK